MFKTIPMVLIALSFLISPLAHAADSAAPGAAKVENKAAATDPTAAHEKADAGESKDKDCKCDKKDKKDCSCSKETCKDGKCKHHGKKNCKHCKMDKDHHANKEGKVNKDAPVDEKK